MAHVLQGSVYGVVGTVALGRSGQVDGCLGQGYATLRPPYLLHGIEGGICQEQGIGVCQTYVLRGRDYQAPCYEGRVFPTLYHACQPVDGGIGVAASYALDEGRDDVVVHLSVLVVCQGVLLKALRHQRVGHLQRLALLHALGQEFQDVEQLACIASAIPEQGIGLLQDYTLLPEHRVLFHHTAAQGQQVVLREGVQRVHLASAQ